MSSAIAPHAKDVKRMIDVDQATEQNIRQRAYELWLSAGKPEGSSLRFWKEAEAELALEAMQAPNGETLDNHATADDVKK